MTCLNFYLLRWRQSTMPPHRLIPPPCRVKIHSAESEGYSTLGVKKPVKGIAPTELVHLETRKMYQDFNYEMENGWWYHIEFESDPLTKADLRRFRKYEAATSRTYGVEVLTCVICTANRKHILTEITEGINTYRVKLIQMKKKDGDKILRKIQKKKKLKRKDLIPVLLSPLMCGKSEIKTRIL